MSFAVATVPASGRLFAAARNHAALSARNCPRSYRRGEDNEVACWSDSLHWVLNHEKFPASDFSSLRTAYSGSAPLSEQTLRRWTEHTGTLILEGFGPQAHSFYGLPWVAGRAGLGHIAGPTVMQACATGVRTLLAAAWEVEVGMCGASLALTCDRTSNGPQSEIPKGRVALARTKIG
jgi:acyl-CoA synthetase (AMP-forming)/AMP-acid ligase II